MVMLPRPCASNPTLNADPGENGRSITLLV
jgi:hypothetical protein